MPYTEHLIPIHPLAPAKVPYGVACNGCGVCCAYAPCPLGMVLSHRRSGACAVLHWDGVRTQYRCGGVVAPQDALAQSLPRGARWAAPLLAPLLRRLALRWIAAGTGCDSSLEVLPTRSGAADPGATDPGSATMTATDLPTVTRRIAHPLDHD